MLSRVFYIGTYPLVQLGSNLTYKSLLRPILEYAAVLWEPHTLRFNNVSVPDCYLTPVSWNNRGHPSRFIQLQTNIDVYKYSFYPSAIRPSQLT